MFISFQPLELSTCKFFPQPIYSQPIVRIDQEALRHLQSSSKVHANQAFKPGSPSPTLITIQTGIPLGIDVN